jgi:hypothetical protein
MENLYKRPLASLLKIIAIGAVIVAASALAGCDWVKDSVDHSDCSNYGDCSITSRCNNSACPAHTDSKRKCTC